MLTYYNDYLYERFPALHRRLWHWLEKQGYAMCEWMHDFGCPCDTAA